MSTASMPFPPPPHDTGGAEDVRVELRRDHDAALAELEALRHENDERRCQERLRRLRQAWMIHALAEESVIYRMLESLQASDRADERFIEHELVGGLFEKLAHTRPNTLEWRARLKVVRDLIERHIEMEQADIFARLARQLDEEGLREAGGRFRSAHRKLEMLERLKAA
jgi:hypothetical protein